MNTMSDPSRHEHPAGFGLPQELVYEVDRRGALRAVAFHSGLALAMLLFLVLLVPRLPGNGQSSPFVSFFAGAAGLLGVGLFATLALRFLLRLASGEPLLVINARGLQDNASGVFSGAGWIDWAEVAEVRLSTYQGLRAVEIVPRDRQLFLSRLGRVERVARSARLGYPALALRGPLLPLDPAVLAEQIQAYWLRGTGGR